MLQIDKNGAVDNNVKNEISALVEHDAMTLVNGIIVHQTGGAAEQLEITLRIPSTEVFRHPTVSRKNSSEASTAQW